MVNAIIMASGQSKRMGENKLLLPYKGKTILEHVLDEVINCDFNDILVIYNHEEIFEICNKRNIKSVYNSKSDTGQSKAIKLGIENSTEVDGYAFFTGDQPLVDVETIELLLKAFYENKSSIIVPNYNGRRGAPVIFSKDFKDQLLELEGDVGGRSIMNKTPSSIRLINVKNEAVLWDIDTKEDYKKLLESEIL